MSPNYHLNGMFIEACNCEVICPCWVDDEPDEDFCVGLFAWRFDPGSSIGGHDVSGRTVVSASVHMDRRRGGDTSSVIFTDSTTAPVAAELLATAFAGSGGGPLAQLADVTGDVLLARPADITLTEEPDGSWEVRVDVEDLSLIHVEGTPRRFDLSDFPESEAASRPPLRLTGTALHHDLSIEGEVTAAQADRLQVDVTALPSPGIDYRGRSGMAGRFRYDFDGDPGEVA